MAYAVPQSKKSIKQNKFEFKFPNEPDTVYSVPLLKFLKPSIIFGHDSAGGDLAVAQRIFAEYLPDTFEKFDDTVQLEAFMLAWKEASGIDVGESSASPS